MFGDAVAHARKPSQKESLNIPTIHVSGRTVSFREGEWKDSHIGVVPPKLEGEFRCDWAAEGGFGRKKASDKHRCCITMTCRMAWLHMPQDGTCLYIPGLPSQRRSKESSMISSTWMLKIPEKTPCRKHMFPPSGSWWENVERQDSWRDGAKKCLERAAFKTHMLRVNLEVKVDDILLGFWSSLRSRVGKNWLECWNVFPSVIRYPKTDSSTFIDVKTRG